MRRRASPTGRAIGGVRSRSLDSRNVSGVGGRRRKLSRHGHTRARPGDGQPRPLAVTVRGPVLASKKGGGQHCSLVLATRDSAEARSTHRNRPGARRSSSESSTSPALAGSTSEGLEGSHAGRMINSLKPLQLAGLEMTTTSPYWGSCRGLAAAPRRSGVCRSTEGTMSGGLFRDELLC